MSIVLENISAADFSVRCAVEAGSVGCAAGDGQGAHAEEGPRCGLAYASVIDLPCIAWHWEFPACEWFGPRAVVPARTIAAGSRGEVC